jgi:hypothetical protein
MPTSLCKIELLAMIKQHNKHNKDKIQNVDKMKKTEIVAICKKYNIYSENIDTTISKICLSTVNKKHLLQDIELFFLQKGKTIPKEFSTMKKKQLIEYMEQQDIDHYTQQMIEEEIKKCNIYNHNKDIIYYNMICYNNVNISEIDDNDLESYIQNHNLKTNIVDLKQVSSLLSNIYSSISAFCEKTGETYVPDKFKSFPKVIEFLETRIVRQ